MIKANSSRPIPIHSPSYSPANLDITNPVAILVRDTITSVARVMMIPGTKFVKLSDIKVSDTPEILLLSHSPQKFSRDVLNRPVFYLLPPLFSMALFFDDDRAFIDSLNSNPFFLRPNN
jgi:hypothetical protein